MLSADVNILYSSLNCKRLIRSAGSLPAAILTPARLQAALAEYVDVRACRGGAPARRLAEPPRRSIAGLDHLGVAGRGTETAAKPGPALSR
jgi:hypothetical protein